MFKYSRMSSEFGWIFLCSIHFDATMLRPLCQSICCFWYFHMYEFYLCFLKLGKNGGCFFFVCLYFDSMCSGNHPKYMSLQDLNSHGWAVPWNYCLGINDKQRTLEWLVWGERANLWHMIVDKRNGQILPLAFLSLLLKILQKGCCRKEQLLYFSWTLDLIAVEDSCKAAEDLMSHRQKQW